MLNSINATMNYGQISKIQQKQMVNFRGATVAPNKLERSPENTDVFEPTKNDDGMSLEDKQLLVKKARKKASGWAILGGIFSTLYYGLRSDDKIADKFDLDPEKDKALIQKIKHDQTMWSLTGLLPGLGPIIGWIVASAQNPNKINVS